MTISVKDFWRLLAESRLLSPANCQKLSARLAEMKGQPNAVASAQWLVTQKAITKYQAKVLLSGRSGPFHYGPYQLRDRLTTGRLSGCFRAVHVPTRHPVLLWFLSGPVLEDPAAYARAIHQVGAVGRAVHPCLAQVYQLVDLGDYKFIALEDLIGVAAGETLAARGRLPAAEACRVMRHVALAASALHACGIAHGDIRPRNIWIDSAGGARLLQLPLSREPHLPPTALLDPSLPADVQAIVADYAAPELAGSGEHDAQADVYAIGCALYHLLSGRPPFAGGDAATKRQQHAAATISPLEAVGVSAKLFKVISYALAKDRRRRPAAAQLAEALAHFVTPQLMSALPERPPTYDSFEAWRQTQPLAPQLSPAATPVASQSSSKPAVVAASESPPPMVDRFPGTPQAPVSVEPSRAAAAIADPQPAAYPDTLPFERVQSNTAALNGAVNIPLVTEASGAISATALVRQRRRKARNNALFVLALLVAVGIGLGIGYAVYRRGEVAQNSQGQHAGESAPGNGGSTEESHASSTGQIDNASDQTGSAAVIPDDGKTLWVSPTDGKPISWAYLPPRAEIVLALKPSELLRHAEGEKLLAALGPQGSNAKTALEEAVGMPLAEVEHLTMAWTNTGAQWMPTLVVRPTASIPLEAFAAKWQAFEPREQGPEKFYVSAPTQRAYFAPAAEQGGLFVVGAADQMPEIVGGGPNASPLVREMVKLLQTSDSQRGCTLLFTKKALLLDIQPQFEAAGLSRLREALAWGLGDGSQAASFSLHLAENCYLEARIVATAQTTTAAELTTTTRERMSRLAPEIEDFLGRIELHPHGRRILIGLTTMARFVQEQLRIDSEDDQVVINCYLPAVAAHNLAFAADLAVTQPASAAATTPVTSAGPSAATSIADKLQKSISFTQTGDTLEKALQTVAGEIGAPIEILGNDFIPEGITRNNRFDVTAQNMPAGQVIRQILLKANPDGKLVYVIRPESPAGQEAILVTTRAAAARRGDKLPAVFASPAGGEDAKKSPAAKKK